MKKYRNSGRTVYCDNFFTTLELGKSLMQRGLATVSIVRAKRKFFPLFFTLIRKTRPYKNLDLAEQEMQTFNVFYVSTNLSINYIFISSQDPPLTSMVTKPRPTSELLSSKYRQLRKLCT